MASILVVEDDVAIRELIAVNLLHAGHAVGSAPDAEGALAIVNGALPDLVVLDWGLPGMSGVSLLRALRETPRTESLGVLMLSARATEADRIAGLDAGADDYMAKPFSPREMVARVRAVLRGRAPQTTDEAIEIAGLRLEPATRSAYTAERPVAVAPTEFRLLHFLMTHPERVHSRSEVLDRVWGDHVYLDERTVDVHIGRLRRALEPSGHHRMIETVRGSGYRLSASADG